MATIASAAVTPSRRVYLDHNATTPVAPEVREAMLPFLGDDCGNPSSIHGFGNRARAALEAARRMVAQGLNCTSRRIIFTGGGSEADNLAIGGGRRLGRLAAPPDCQQHRAPGGAGTAGPWPQRDMS